MLNEAENHTPPAPPSRSAGAGEYPQSRVKETLKATGKRNVWLWRHNRGRGSASSPQLHHLVVYALANISEVQGGQVVEEAHMHQAQ